jgi:hypothetical protein
MKGSRRLERGHKGCWFHKIVWVHQGFNIVLKITGKSHCICFLKQNISVILCNSYRSTFIFSYFCGIHGVPIQKTPSNQVCISHKTMIWNSSTRKTLGRCYCSNVGLVSQIIWWELIFLPCKSSLGFLSMLLSKCISFDKKRKKALIISRLFIIGFFIPHRFN